MRTALAIILTLASTTATAAEVTDFPPELRADISFDYSYRFLFGSIEETVDGKQWGYGRRTETQHDILPHIEFSPFEGIAVTMGADATPMRRYAFPDEPGLFCPEGYGCEGSSKMYYDPVQQTGSYGVQRVLMADVGETAPEYKGSGLNGLWFGLALQPFAERYGRSHRVTWRLDFAFRTGNPNNSFWTLREDGTRGAAPGGAAAKIGAAFSSDNGSANPYFKATYITEGAFNLDEYRDADGTVYWEGVGGRINPADRLDATGGVELIVAEDRKAGTRAAIDFYMGFGYRSWEDIPSGILLPSVLEDSKHIVVTHYDHIVGIGGLGFDAHFNQYVGMRVAFDSRYYTPHPLEHVYPVRSDYDTIQFGLNASLDVKIR